MTSRQSVMAGGMVGSSFPRLTGERLVGLGVVQLYLAYVLVLALLAFALTSGDNGPKVMVTVLGSCMLLAGVYAIARVVLGHHALAGLIVALLLAGLPMAQFLRYPVALVGCVGLVLLVSEWRRFDLRGLLALPLLLVVVFGSTIYADFAYEKYLSGGRLNIDSLFHAAIAAMYKNYGVPSIGLDGLVPIGYHTLSHKIMAGLSVLSGLDVLSTYGHLFFVLAPMVLAFSLAGLALRINREMQFRSALLNVALLLLVVIIMPVFRQVGFGDSYFTSESYLMGLVLLMASLSALFAYRDEPEKPILLVAALALIVLAGMAKGSVGLLGFCVLGLFGLVALRSLRYWLALLLAAAVFYILVIDAVQGADSFVQLKPFDFVERYVQAFDMKGLPRKLSLFIVFHYLPVWICLAAGFTREGRRYALSNEFLTLFALLPPALLLSLMIEIPGGAVYYFSNVPVLVSFAFLAARSDRLGEGNWLRLVGIVVACLIVYLVGRKLKLFGADVSYLFLVSLLLLIVVTNYGLVSKRWFFVLSMAGAAYMVAAPAIVARTIFTKVAPSPVDASYQVAQLRAARERLPVSTQVRLENTELLAEKIGCGVYWALPALLERPMVGGLPRPPWCDYLNGTYGLAEYLRGKPKVELGLGEQPLRLAP